MEPYCNHDAPAIHDGICECGAKMATVTFAPGDPASVLRALRETVSPEVLWQVANDALDG